MVIESTHARDGRGPADQGAEAVGVSVFWAIEGQGMDGVSYVVWCGVEVGVLRRGGEGGASRIEEGENRRDGRQVTYAQGSCRTLVRSVRLGAEGVGAVSERGSVVSRGGTG